MSTPPPVALLHTAAAHTRTFGGLFAELAPDVPVDHMSSAPICCKTPSGAAVEAAVALYRELSDTTRADGGRR